MGDDSEFPSTLQTFLSSDSLFRSIGLDDGMDMVFIDNFSNLPSPVVVYRQQISIDQQRVDALPFYGFMIRSRPERLEELDSPCGIFLKVVLQDKGM